MQAGATINASATESGDGGKIVLWSDVLNPESITRAFGTLLARAGELLGDGGQIETSGSTLDTTGAIVNAGAANGNGGLWLLDPYDYSIDAVAAANIASTLNTGTSVTVTTTANNPAHGTNTNTNPFGGIRLSGDLITGAMSGDATLTLMAHLYISLGGMIDATQNGNTKKLNVVLWSDLDANQQGSIRVVNEIKTNGGGLWMGGGDGTAQWTPYDGAASITVGDSAAYAYISSYDQGIEIANDSGLYTDGGNIHMASRAGGGRPQQIAITIYPGVTIDSGLGTITIDAGNDAVSGPVYTTLKAISMYGIDSNPITIRSDNTSADAIRFFADQTGVPQTGLTALSGDYVDIISAGGVTFAADFFDFDNVSVNHGSSFASLSINPDRNGIDRDFTWTGSLSGNDWLGGGSLSGLKINDFANLQSLTFGDVNLFGNINLNAAIMLGGDIGASGQRIVVNAGLTSTGGDIRLDADTGAHVAGIERGIDINADITTTSASNGDITLVGRGGADGTGGGYQHGVYLNNADVSAGGTGDVSMFGFGGRHSTGGHNRGIHQYGGSVTTENGDIVMAGFGGGTAAATDNFGVNIEGLSSTDKAIVSAGGDGTVLINGFGGAFFGATQLGVNINAGDVSSDGGTITVDGNGGWNNAASRGLSIHNTVLGDDDSGNITLRGTTSGTGNALQMSSTTIGNANYSGDVSIFSDAISASASSLNTSGELSVQSNDSSFTSAIDWIGTGLTITDRLSGLFVGSVSNGSSIHFNSALNVAGDVQVYGGEIEVNQAITSTGGEIRLDAYSPQHSAGITSGLRVIGDLTTTDGDIRLLGRGGTEQADRNYHGVYLGNVAISAGGSGGVFVTGEGRTGSFVADPNNSLMYNNTGVWLERTSIQTNDNDISITGYGGSAAESIVSKGVEMFGVLDSDAVQLSAGGWGAVQITGWAASGTEGRIHSLIIDGANISTDRGSVLLDARAGTGIGAGLGLYGSQIGDADTGDITIQGTGSRPTDNSHSGGITTLGTNGYSRSIFVIQDDPWFAATKVITTGDLVIAPFGDRFTGVRDGITGFVWNGWLDLSESTLSDLTIGKMSNDTTLRINADINVDDDIMLQGGDIQINAAMTSNDITRLWASGNVTDGPNGYILTDQLELRGIGEANWSDPGTGNFVLDNALNDANELSFWVDGGVQYNDANSLNIRPHFGSEYSHVEGDLKVSAGGTLSLLTDLGSDDGFDMTLKSNDNIYIAGQTITTRGGDVILWSDADSDGVGGIHLDTGTTIDARIPSDFDPETFTLGGGLIVLGGGADNGANGNIYNANDGVPDNYTGYLETSNGRYGILLGDDTAGGSDSDIQIYSDNNIMIYGSANNPDGLSVGIQAMPGFDINSGFAGVVEIVGRAEGTDASSASIGVRLGRTDAEVSSQIKSHHSSIVVSGTAASDAGTSNGVFIAGNHEQRTSLVATGGGWIEMPGSRSGESSGEFNFGTTLLSTDLLAATGRTQISSSGGDLFWGDVYLGAKAGTDVTHSNSHIRLAVPGSLTMAESPNYVNTTGLFEFKSEYGRFDRPTNFSDLNIQFDSVLSGLQVRGKANEHLFTMDQAVVVEGDIEIDGDRLLLTESLTSNNGRIRLEVDEEMTGGTFATLTADTLTLRGDGDIFLDNSLHRIGQLSGSPGSLKFTNEGPLELSSRLTVDNSLEISTATGDITIEGQIRSWSFDGISQIVINAGVDSAAGTAAGGNIVLVNSPDFSIAHNGIIRLYSGSEPLSLGLSELAAGDRNRIRHRADETTDTSADPFGIGVNIIYRGANRSADHHAMMDLLAKSALDLIVRPRSNEYQKHQSNPSSNNPQPSGDQAKSLGSAVNGLPDPVRIDLTVND